MKPIPQPTTETSAENHPTIGGRCGSDCSPDYRPFSNAIEFIAWNNENCARCSKGPSVDHEGPNEECDIENAFALASLCGGTIVDGCIGDAENARKIAARLGWDGRASLKTPCPEFQANNNEHSTPKNP